MTGKEQRVKQLAERLQGEAPAQGKGQSASERLAARLREMSERLTPEERARGMLEENPEKALQVALAILAQGEDPCPHLTDAALWLLGGNEEELARESRVLPRWKVSTSGASFWARLPMVEADRGAAGSLARAILALTEVSGK